MGSAAHQAKGLGMCGSWSASLDAPGHGAGSLPAQPPEREWDIGCFPPCPLPVGVAAAVGRAAPLLSPGSLVQDTTHTFLPGWGQHPGNTGARPAGRRARPAPFSLAPAGRSFPRFVAGGQRGDKEWALSPPPGGSPVSAQARRVPQEVARPEQPPRGDRFDREAGPGPRAAQGPEAGLCAPPSRKNRL
ncbi:50S ribosomal protein L5 [Platysternon megacephalum]|uniref:50S ribosomal protein L5 n=1 Tax=Platysternon megacephalum TaxID=55544 RepID=A0A4D9DFG9_9SAUR|nr:50S ribosomal protein L5 [Platysternon megacephalum]